MKKISSVVLIVGGILEIIPCLPVNILGFVMAIAGIVFVCKTKEIKKPVSIVSFSLALIVGVCVLLLAISMQGANSVKVLGFDATLSGIIQIILAAFSFVALFVAPKLLKKDE